MTQDGDPWQHLSRWTSARIALGRAGASLPTREVLRFALAHAQARDAVHAALDVGALSAQLPEVLGAPIVVESQALERALYLRRPDLGRKLSARGTQVLHERPRNACDVAIVVGDGLSARAIEAHAGTFLRFLVPQLSKLGLKPSSPIIALGARVALGDVIAAGLGARSVAMLIGERPGLSSPDSMGVYFTFAPNAGSTDANRNCISNIRAEGLSYELAAFKLSWLIREAMRRGLSGVALKDESDLLLEGGVAPYLLDGA